MTDRVQRKMQRSGTGVLTRFVVALIGNGPLAYLPNPLGHPREGGAG